MKSVRFLANFIITTVVTKVDAEGQLTTQQSLRHITYGETYILNNYEVNNNLVTLYFPDDGPLQGTAPNIELGYCQLTDSVQIQQQNAQAAAQTTNKSGCGGCGGHR